MPDIQRATIKQLAYKIKGTGKAGPRFAFLLGAGASRQSGIFTASEMIRFFKQQIVEQEYPDGLKTDAEKEKWLSEQEWYQRDGSEYSKCFERYEPKEMGRQRYIESIIEGRKPSFGYVVLANLMARNYTNTIITTNFDDLMYSACTTYTDIRPIVFAYGILASEMRLAIPRPKILKLHGDFLYSALKNTDRELQTQDPNMARQVLQVLNEYGLVVVGYAGNDKSLMEILSRISEKNDLYWCVRHEEPNDDVKKMLHEKGGFLVEIAGFDELMNEIRGIVGFDVRAMLGSIQERQKEVIEQLKSFAPRYSIAILREIVAALTDQLTRQQDQNQKILALYLFAQGLEAQGSGQLFDAEVNFRKAIELNPTDVAAYSKLGNVLAATERISEAEAFLKKAIELDPSYGDAFYNLAQILARDPDRATDAEAMFAKAIDLGHISVLNLSSIAYNALVRAGFTSVEEILKVIAPTEEKRESLRKFAEKVRELQETAIANVTKEAP